MTLPDNPYTREEMYLSAIVDGGSSGIPTVPYTRKEQYLAAIAKGDSSGIPDTPYTREEMYLDAIAKNGGGGGGGMTIKSKEYDVTFSNNAYVQPFSKVAYIMYDSDVTKSNVIKVSSSALTAINVTFWNDRICLCGSQAELTAATMTVYYLD